MVKAKNKQMGAFVTKKGKASGGFVESSNGAIEGDLCEDDEWVVVKKQKVTILIPPLQTTRKALKTNQVSTKPRKSLRSRKKRSGGDYKCSINKRSLAAKLARPTLEFTQKGVNHVVGQPTVQQISSDFVHDHLSHRGHGSLKAFRVSGAPKAVKILTAFHSASHQEPARSLRPIGCLGASALQNRMMRASNLERKLDRSGGLSRWLLSLGLECFVKMFHSKNVDKFQLLNMTMEKLKDMGASAVGPRRKLMHAIDCLSQPYCFSTL